MKGGAQRCPAIVRSLRHSTGATHRFPRRNARFSGACRSSPVHSPRAAYAVAGSERTDADVIDTLANLVAKSLVDADIGGNEPQYSLLETTRAYAHEKLAETGEVQETARRHAEYLRSLFAQAQAEWDSRPRRRMAGRLRP